MLDGETMFGITTDLAGCPAPLDGEYGECKLCDGNRALIEAPGRCMSDIDWDNPLHHAPGCPWARARLHVLPWAVFREAYTPAGQTWTHREEYLKGFPTREVAEAALAGPRWKLHYFPSAAKPDMTYRIEYQERK